MGVGLKGTGSDEQTDTKSVSSLIHQAVSYQDYPTIFGTLGRHGARKARGEQEVTVLRKRGSTDGQ